MIKVNYAVILINSLKQTYYLYFDIRMSNTDASLVSWTLLV